ncbi:MAG: HigA family addiction module antitoxin [Candidatus Omnitrophota bacterium]
MIDLSLNQYRPDFVSPPGETLKEVLDSLGRTHSDLAEKTGCSQISINGIIQGEKSITAEMANQLEKALGFSASFWINRENQYRESLALVEENPTRINVEGIHEA